jgi:hypothetical protein
MRRILVVGAALLVAVLAVSACKKAIQDAKEDFVVNLIVSNLWVISNFTEGPANITSQFAEYEFKFNRDLSVFGRKAGQPDAVGTWRGDASAMTITSAFPSGPAPLHKLTGVWNITRTTLSSVKATRTEAGTVMNLELQKK